MNALERAQEVYNLMKQKESIDEQITTLMGGGGVNGSVPRKGRKKPAGARVAPPKKQPKADPGLQPHSQEEEPDSEVVAAPGAHPCCGSKGKRHKKNCPAKADGAELSGPALHHYECMDCGKEFSDEFDFDTAECPTDPSHHLIENQ